MAHITIGDISPRIQYEGDGGQTEFTYPFPIFAATDMAVYLGDTLQVSGYSVAGAGASAGGTVTFNAAPADGVTVTLVRAVPIARTSDFPDAGAFRAATLNTELDRVAAALQQLKEELGRTLRRSVWAEGTGSLQLPNPVPGRAMRFDGAGNIGLSAHDPDATQTALDAVTVRISAAEADIGALEEDTAALHATDAAHFARAIRAPENIAALPQAAGRALKVMAFDAAGNPIAVPASAEGVVPIGAAGAFMWRVVAGEEQRAVPANWCLHVHPFVLIEPDATLLVEAGGLVCA